MNPDRAWMPLLPAILLIGCSTPPVAQRTVQAPPNYARALAEGQPALRKITDPKRLPDLALAYRNADPTLLEAIDESIAWFEKPSSRKCFPVEGITHQQARASLLPMRELLLNGLDAQAFAREVAARFDVYESVGYDGSGIVLFTGYYAPVLRASRTPSGPFVHPLYKRPADLVTDAESGEPRGRRLPDGSVVPYYTRREIESQGILAGNELVWIEDPLDAYIVHVNGSAKLRLEGADGPEVMYVGYSGKTDRPYKGLGQSLVEAGLVSPDELSLATIKRIYRRDPKLVMELADNNESYVFFTEYDGGRWPAGSLNAQVTPERTLATDKKVYPRGGLVLVDTTQVTFAEQKRPFFQFMLDQDTGGAIKAPGRADIFMGVGPSAEILAGGQYAEGRLYYLFLKPQAPPVSVAGRGAAHRP
jgi:peptidoglycan lytic transglycosylase A